MKHRILFSDEEAVFSQRPDQMTLKDVLLRTLKTGEAVTLPVAKFKTRDSARSSVQHVANVANCDYECRINGKVFTAWLVKR